MKSLSLTDMWCACTGRESLCMQPTTHFTGMHYHSNCRLNNTRHERHESIPIQAAALNSHTAKPVWKGLLQLGLCNRKPSECSHCIVAASKQYPKKKLRMLRRLILSCILKVHEIKQKHKSTSTRSTQPHYQQVSAFMLTAATPSCGPQLKQSHPSSTQVPISTAEHNHWLQERSSFTRNSIQHLLNCTHPKYTTCTLADLHSINDVPTAWPTLPRGPLLTTLARNLNRRWRLGQTFPMNTLLLGADSAPQSGS